MFGRRALLVLLAFALTSASISAQAAPASQPGQKGPWELVRDDQGIIVHRRTVAGSKLHEFRGVGLIEAPIASVLSVLNDSEHRLEWMKKSVANTRIEQPDPYTEVFYSRTGAPWPIADRDIVLRARTTFDPGAGLVRIDITSQSHPKWPPRRGIVRMPFLRGHWFLWPENGGAYTRAEYQIHADPGGMLPDWIINRVSRKIPHETIASMQWQVKTHRGSEFEKRVESLPAYQTIINSKKEPPKFEAKADAKAAPVAPTVPAVPPPDAQARAETPAPKTPDHE